MAQIGLHDTLTVAGKCTRDSTTGEVQMVEDERQMLEFLLSQV